MLGSGSNGDMTNGAYEKRDVEYVNVYLKLKLVESLVKGQKHTVMLEAGENLKEGDIVYADANGKMYTSGDVDYNEFWGLDKQ